MHVNLMTQVYAGSPTQGQSRPGPAFVATAPAVAAHPGLESLGARLDRPGLRRRHLLRRGASRAGAARCPVGPAGAPPRRNSGRWPGAARGPAGPARHLSSPSSPPSRCTPAAWGPDGLRRRHRRRPRRRGASRAGGGPGLVRPGLWSLILRCVIRCASESSVRRGPAAGRFYLSSCAFTHWTWVGR